MSFAKSEDCFITLSIESGNTNSNGVKKMNLKQDNVMKYLHKVAILMQNIIWLKV